MRDDGYIQRFLLEAAEYESIAAQLKTDAAYENLRPFYLIKPKVYPDGDKWCALYGDNVQNGVAAFGDTPKQASIQFDIEWLNQKATKETK
jgi:hypothetical protein